MHVESLYPLVSPDVVRVAKRSGVPVVQAVRNFRLVCPAGSFFRDGHGCHECAGPMRTVPAVVHGCWNGRVKTVPMAVGVAVHRSTARLVDHWLPTSRFLAEHVRSVGVPSARVTVKPNAVADPGEPSPIRQGVVFAGRLDEAKGVRILLDAWRRAGAATGQRLVLLGDGELRAEAEAAAAELGTIDVRGRVSGDEAAATIAQARVIVAPSVWDEPFGRTVIEGFAAGRPVIATRVGGQAELIDDEVGWPAEPSAESLARCLSAMADDEEVMRRGRGARTRYLERFTEERSFEVLLSVYEGLTGRHR